MTPGMELPGQFPGWDSIGIGHPTDPLVCVVSPVPVWEIAQRRIAHPLMNLAASCGELLNYHLHKQLRGLFQESTVPQKKATFVQRCPTEEA